MRLDYGDFLRHRKLHLWAKDDRRRAELVRRRCATAEEVAEWVEEIHGRNGLYGQRGVKALEAPLSSIRSIPSIKSTYPEIAANAALVLVGVACALLDRQIEALARAFTEEGGFTERLHRIRTERRCGG